MVAGAKKKVLIYFASSIDNPPWFMIGSQRKLSGYHMKVIKLCKPVLFCMYLYLKLIDGGIVPK